MLIADLKQGTLCLNSNNNYFEELPMKRQKRDRLDRAHSQGYKAGITGRSRETCPYQSSESKSQWLGGWREAISDRNIGLFK